MLAIHPGAKLKIQPWPSDDSWQILFSRANIKLK